MSKTSCCLTTILRDEWKFDGFVVPDSGAVLNLVTAHRKYPTLEEAAAKTILAGSDLDDGAYARALPKALAEGLLTEKDIDQSLRRVLRVRFRLGEFDPPEMVPYSKLGPDMIDSPAHRQLALRTAQESIVLLTNKNNFLPLDKSQIKTLAVIGPFADIAQTGPNYTGQYSKFVKPLEGIQQKVGSGTQVLYARGSGILESDNPEASIAEAVAAAKKADVAILFVGINQMLEREGIDRDSLNLPPVQLRLVHSVLEANPKTVVVLLNGGPVSSRRRASAVEGPVHERWIFPRWSTCSGRRGRRHRNCRRAFRGLQPGRKAALYGLRGGERPAADDRIRHHQGIYLHVFCRQAGVCVRPRTELYHV